jgi:serine/threonine protein phosphatase 1
MPRTYAIGDIHGCLDKLERLVARCRSDAGSGVLNLVFLGDAVDRGPDSCGVVKYLMALQQDARGQVICLCGNHEDMALGSIADPSAAPHWIARNGGAEMLRSYGVARPEDLPADHVEWMRALPTHHDDGMRFYVHAGIDPERPLDAQKRRDMLWMREPFLSDRRDFGRFVVHGHTPLKDGRPDLQVNRVNVDTAAVLGGPLTAAIFNDEQRGPLGFLQET